MLTIERTPRFKKQFRLMLKRGRNPDLLANVVEELANCRPLAERYRDHPLTGNLAGFRECHIQPDWLLVYLVEKDVLTLTLTQTGTHADLFGE